MPMKKIVAVFISLITGGVGFVSGYLISKKKHLAQADKDLESMRAYQKEHDEWLEQHIKEKYGITDEEVEKSVKKPAKKVSPMPKLNIPKEPVVNPKIPLGTTVPTNPQPNPNKTNYSAMYPTGTDSISKGDIVVIAKDELFNSTFNQETLYFYTEDKALTDSEDNLIKHVPKMVGPIDSWEKYFVDGVDKIYIRNLKLETDYTIIKIDGSWKEMSPNAKETLIDVDPESNEDDDDDGGY